MTSVWADPLAAAVCKADLVCFTVNVHCWCRHFPLFRPIGSLYTLLQVDIIRRAVHFDTSGVSLSSNLIIYRGCSRASVFSFAVTLQLPWFLHREFTSLGNDATVNLKCFKESRITNPVLFTKLHCRRQTALCLNQGRARKCLAVVYQAGVTE